MDFFSANIEEIKAHFNTDTGKGLDADSVLAASIKYGKNQLKSVNTRGILRILFEQFVSPLSLILIVASVISFYMQAPRDGIILAAIVFINGFIGFFQEWKSENILASVRKLVVEKCNVLREGKLVEIFSEDIVPGDIIFLNEGDGIPADTRLIESSGFSVNEFILTGESFPSSKNHLEVSQNKISLSEIKNVVFMGTTVARGSAKGIVFATGGQTEIGRISSSSQKIKASEAPIQVEIKDVAKKLVIGTLIIAAFLFGTRLLLNDTIALALVFSISVAAAMVPEGLPAQISMALALAVGRLAKRKAIVKKIAAAQTLGSATVIASDKTGTITKNEMTITGCYFNGKNFSASGLGYMPTGEILNDHGLVLHKENLGDLKIFFLSGFLSSTGRINPPDKYHTSWYCIGDPTEAAFATLAMKAGYVLEDMVKDYPLVQAFSFDSFRKRASIIRTHKGKIISFVKGSIETVLEISGKVISEDAIQELNPNKKKEILAVAGALAGNGLRVIAIAYKDMINLDTYTVEEAESGLIFAGFVTMLDPPHEEVKEAIESVFKAHIRVFMITGDNEITAKAIAKSIGLMNENNEFPQVINGFAMKTLSDEEICLAFKKRAVIFSRVSPDDKYRIVDLLKKQGEIIAVTGDGVNDTLSLKRADIGVAMGKNGSKVAQEAANIILLDDNFSTIVVAIKEGRTIFRNLEKTIKTNLSSNIAELICVIAGFAGAFFGIPTPILAVQILLIDMAGEMLPLIMLTYDPPERTIMINPPRDPAIKILTKETILGILFNGSIMGICAYVAFIIAVYHNIDLTGQYQKAMTITFVSIVFGQFANLLSRRTIGPVLSKYLFSNKKLLIGFGISLTLILLIIYIPLFNLYFHTAALLPEDWLFPLVSGIICLLVFEYRKRMQTLKGKKQFLESTDSFSQAPN
jgi:Ca2+-transporting ATPase